jgi:hypothetical protein
VFGFLLIQFLKNLSIKRHVAMLLEGKNDLVCITVAIL